MVFSKINELLTTTKTIKERLNNLEEEIKITINKEAVELNDFALDLFSDILNLDKIKEKCAKIKESERPLRIIEEKKPSIFSSEYSIEKLAQCFAIDVTQRFKSKLSQEIKKHIDNSKKKIEIEKIKEEFKFFRIFFSIISQMTFESVNNYFSSNELESLLLYEPVIENRQDEDDILTLTKRELLFLQIFEVYQISLKVLDEEFIKQKSRKFLIPWENSDDLKNNIEKESSLFVYEEKIGISFLRSKTSKTDFILKRFVAEYFLLVEEKGVRSSAGLSCNKATTKKIKDDVFLDNKQKKNVLSFKTIVFLVFLSVVSLILVITNLKTLIVFFNKKKKKKQIF